MPAAVSVRTDELRRRSGSLLLPGIILTLLALITFAFAVLTTIVLVLIFGALILP